VKESRHPRPAHLLVALTLAAGILGFAGIASAQTTYTWDGSTSTAWGTSSNWTPTRTTPATNDVLVFNTGTWTVTAVPTQTIGRLTFTGNTTVTMQNAAAVTLTINGGTGTDLDIQAGTTVTLNSTGSALTMALGASATSSIAGALTIQGNAHQITSGTASAIQVLNGGSVTTGTGYTGSAFGTTGTASVAVFQSGSTYRHNAGNSVFALTQPASKAVFQAGSNFIVRTTTGYSASGRTYGNLTIQNNTAISGTGTANFAFGTLDIESGSSFTHAGSSTASLTISGNLTTAGTGNVSLTSGSGGIQLNGSGVQTLGGPGTGTITFASSATVATTSTLALARSLTQSAGTLTINGGLRFDPGGNLTVTPVYGANGALTYATTRTIGSEWGAGAAVGSGVPLAVTINPGAGNAVTMPASDRNVPGTLTLTSGRIVTGANNLIVGSAGSVSRTSGHVDGNLRRTVPTGAPSITFDIGNSTNYAPATVAFANVSVAGTLTASTTGADHPNIATAPITASQSANRYWTLTPAGVTFTTFNGTFNFNASDLDAGADPLTFVAGRFASSAWSPLTVGTRTATSTQVTGVNQFGAFAVGEPFFTITASAGANGTITPSGAVSVASGANQAFTITPNTNYVVSDVLVDGGSVGAVTSFTFNNVTANHSISATFAPGNFPLNVTVVGPGTVAKNPNQATYPHASVVQLTATPGSGNVFLGWSGAATGTTNPVNVTMNGTTNVTATFSYRLDINITGGGVVNQTPPGVNHAPGTVVQLTAVPNAGYNFNSWSGSATGSANPLNVTVDQNKTVIANFVLNTYVLSLSTVGSGAISKAPDFPVYTHGSAVQLTANAAIGWNFLGWTGDTTASPNPLTIIVTRPRSLTANFEINQQVLTIVKNGSGAVTVNPDLPTYDYESLVTLTAVPSVGWHFVSWGFDASGTANPVVITMDADKSVLVTFAVNTYTLSLNSVGDGAATRSPNQPTYTHGSVVQLTATPGSGNVFLGWTGNATGTTNPLNLSMDSNKSVTATFSYRLTLSPGPNGAVNASPAGVNQAPGAVVQLTAVPNTGYSFSAWGGDTTGSVNPIDVTMNRNRSYTASFTINQYTLSLVTAGDGSASVSPVQATYPHGTVVQLTATPGSGNVFIGWSGGASGSSSPVALTMDGNQSVTATFSYRIAVSSGPNGAVSQSPTGFNHAPGTVVQLTALPVPGYHFVGWSGSATGTTNPLAVTLDANKTISAAFAIDVYTLNLSTLGDGTVQKSPDQPNYEFGTVVRLTPTPGPLNQFLGWSGDATGSAVPLDVTMTGNKGVTASFTYHLDLQPGAGGVVGAEPEGPNYAPGTIVEVTAVANPGFQFQSWGGALSGSQNPANIEVLANGVVTASFVTSSYTLNINILGFGTVTRNPDLPSYAYGATVVLTATPSTGNQFDGWTGSVSSMLNPLTITMDSPKTVNASFSRQLLVYERAPYAGTWNPIGTGAGAQVLMVAADDSTKSIPLPFPFVYTGITFQANANFLSVNANGFAYFSRSNVSTSSSALSNNVNLYTASDPSTTLAPWYDDLSVGAVGQNPPGQIIYQTIGSPGNQYLVVQWENVSSYANVTGGQPRQINFQLVIFENSNAIEFRYGPRLGASSSSLESASIGLEDSLHNVYIDATTGSRTTTNGMMSSNNWPSLFHRFIPTSPGTLPGGTYGVGPGGYYTSISEAAADLNHKGVSGPITLSLLDAVNDTTAVHGSNIFPILLGPVAGNSPTNSITIRPPSGTAEIASRGTTAGNCGNAVSATVISPTNEPILGLIGADYVTLENLTLTGGSQVDRGMLLIPSSREDGAQHNTIRNVSITLNRANTTSIGLQQSTPLIPTIPEGTNSFNRYLALSVANAYAGVSLAGNSALFDTDNEIAGESGTPTTIGGPAPGDIGGGTPQTFGIRAGFQSNFKVSSSVVRNLSGTGTGTVDGILLENPGSLSTASGTCQIYGNQIFGLTGSSVSAGKVTGIKASVTANNASRVRIFNNVVSDLTSVSGATSTRRIVGIQLQETGGGGNGTIEVDFNSVRLSPQGAACSNACLEMGSVSGLRNRVRNNILANFTAAQSGSAKHYAITTVGAASIGASGSVSDRNILHVNNTVNGFTGLSSTTDRAALSDWQAVATNDGASRAGNPQFASPTNMHLSIVQPTPAEGAASFFPGSNPITWVSDDIDGNPRNGTTPDIGADEGNFIIPNTLDVAATALLDPLPGAFKLTGQSFAPRASFENQGSSNLTNVPVRFRIRGPLPLTTIVYDQPTSIASLVAGAVQNVTFPSTSVASPGQYTIEAINEAVGDVQVANDLVSGTIEVAAPLAGDYPVGTGRAAPFNSLSAAVSRLNSVGVSGPVRFLLENAIYAAPSETFPIAILPIQGGSATNTLTIKPSNGAVTISGVATGALLSIAAADYVTIDGSIFGTSRDLTIVNNNASGGSAVIWGSSSGTDGATNNIVKNVILSGSSSTGTFAGVGFAGTGIGIGSGGTNNVNNRIENILVRRAQVGVYVSGASAGAKGTGTVIIGNQIGAPSPDNVGRFGILTRFEDGIQITQNTVSDLSNVDDFDGIGISLGLQQIVFDNFSGDEVTNATVSRNLIRGVTATGPLGPSAVGIAVARTSSGTTTIVNNMITGVTSPAVDTKMTVGILASGGTTNRVWFNSVNLTGNRGDAINPSLALAVADSVASIDARNNILVNTQTSDLPASSYAIGTVASVGFASMLSNFNDLYTTGGVLAVRGGFLEFDNEVDNIIDWRTLTGRDANSKNAAPLFLSNTNLHINNVGPVSPAANAGQVIAGVTNDFDGDAGLRTTTPDIGADEFSTWALNVAVVGNGTVTRSPNESSFPNGAVVQLTATPASGWTFSGWSGSITGTTNPVSVTMNADKNITATFTINAYTLTTTPIGSGTIARSPNQASYTHGTLVQLTANPAVGFQLTSWGGDGSGSTNPLLISMTSSKTVTATFTIKTYTLALTVVGGGSVVKNPDQPTYNHGTNVQLTATPAANQHFVGWSGDATGSTTPLNLTMTSNVTLTATFAPDTVPLTVNVVGNGTVTKTPNQPFYAFGTVVQLNATPATGYGFTGWSGDATGAVNPLDVTMNAPKTITATFTLNAYTLALTSNGNGTVAKAPDQPTYGHGTNVQITATPAGGFFFVGWSGSATGTTNPLTVTMDANKTIAATFGYHLETTVVGSGSVTRSPDQVNYAPGTVVTLNAAPTTGWSFTGWSGDATGAVTPLDITMNGNKNVTATFTLNTYALNVNIVGNGTVAKNPNQPLYNHGTVVQLTASPAVGWSFTAWSGAATGTTNPVSVTMDAVQNVTATFTINTYSLSVSTVGNGTVAKSPNQPLYDHGTVVQLTANPTTGWSFTSWSGAATGTANPVNVTMDGVKSVTATFTINTYALSVITVGSGTVSKSPDQPLYDHGAVVQLTATPATGWSFASWSGGATGTTSPLAVTMDAAKSVTATFTINTYALTVITVGSGTVARSPDQPLYNHGSLVQLSATPPTGWTFANWSGAVAGTTSPVSVLMDGPKSVTATFLINTYALTVTAVGAGSVTKNPNQTTYDHGSVVQLSATPLTGWHFGSWSGGATGTANPLDLTMDGAKSVTATFLINTYTLAVTVVGTGTIAKSPNQPTYDHGTTVQLTPTPGTGWTFTGWSGDATGSTVPLSVLMEANKSITGTFTVNTYALTVNVTGSGTVARSPNQPLYDHGTVVQLTATPGTGYTFTNWSGGATGTTNPVSVTMDAAKTVNALFTANTHTVTLTGGPNGTVAKSPNLPTYSYGDTVRITATPALGYHFTAWSGSITSTTNPLTLTVDGNKTITGSFAINTYVLNVTVIGNGSVTKSPDLPQYTHGDTVHVTAVAGGGAHFVEWQLDAASFGSNPDAKITFDGPKSVRAVFAGEETVPPTVTVLKANGGEIMAVGQTYEIRWIATDNVAVTSVDIAVSRSGAGGPWEALATGITSTGSFLWVVTGPGTVNGMMRIIARDANGNLGNDLSDASFSIVTRTTGVDEALPMVFALAPVTPNPSTGPATIELSVPREAQVRVSVLDIQGREVAVITDGGLNAGKHRFVWQGDTRGGPASAGVYFVRMRAGGLTFTRRLVLAR